MVGLDNAGKTTVLYRLHLGEAVRTVPTIGSNVEQARRAVGHACLPLHALTSLELVAQSRQPRALLLPPPPPAHHHHSLTPSPPARLQVKVDKPGGGAGHITFEIWDLAGQANLRPSWASYYQSTHAVIVVADCSDR